MFGIGKRLARKFTDNLIEKTVSKSGLSSSQKTDFKTTVNAAIERSQFDEVLDKVDKVQTVVAGAALTAFAPGLSKIIGAGKTTGPLAASLQPGGTGPVSVAQSSAQSGLPSWVVPVAIVAAALLFGKKLFRL